MRLRREWADGGTRARWALVIFLLLILALTALASERKFPPLTGRVVDDAGVLNAATQSQLTDMLAAHERATGQQVVVVTLDSLQGFMIEDFGYQLGRHWGIGQKGTNTGALLIVVPKERKVRIEVGYGLESMLTDAASRVIIERDILPNFRRGDFNSGVLAGTTSMLRVLGGNPPEIGEPATTPSERPDNPAAGGWIILLALLGFSIARRLASRQRGRYRHGWSSSGVGPWGGGGGFSGGGGSFGGGGASGSW
jgi:uncharacterized protein